MLLRLRKDNIIVSSVRTRPEESVRQPLVIPHMLSGSIGTSIKGVTFPSQVALRVDVFLKEHASLSTQTTNPTLKYDKHPDKLVPP